MPGSRAFDALGIGVAVRDVALALESFPNPDEKIAAREIREVAGGPIPNALVTLSRLGRRTAFGGVLGADAAGELVREELVAAGVNVDALASHEGLSTPTSVILVVGRTRTVVECGQEGLPAGSVPVDALLALAAAGTWMLLDGRLPEAQVRAAEAMRALGGRVMLDGGSPRPGLEALIPLADVAVFSHSYARRVGVPAGDESALDEFVRSLAASCAPGGLRIAGLTLGARGSLLSQAGGAALRHAAPRVQAVDTTGAGDVFHGAFADSLIAGASLDAAARFANAAAALSCRGATGRAPLPARASIERVARGGTVEDAT